MDLHQSSTNLYIVCHITIVYQLILHAVCRGTSDVSAKFRNKYITLPVISKDITVTVLKVGDSSLAQRAFCHACHRCHVTRHVRQWHSARSVSSVRSVRQYQCLPCVSFTCLITRHCGQAQLLATIKWTGVDANARVTLKLKLKLKRALFTVGISVNDS